MKEMVCLSKI